MGSLSLKVFQIVGYKNSGKTTVMCELIEALRAEGYKVATLKHHAHIDLNPLHDAGTDTGKHEQCGALVTALAGPYFTQINYSDEPTLSAYVAFYKELNIDVLLIEGFKNAGYPKAVLLRSEEEFEGFKDLNNIKAWITPKGAEISSASAPAFSRENTRTYTSYIINLLEGQT